MLDTTVDLRVLGPSDRPGAMAMVDRNPLVDVYVGSRVYGSTLASRRVGGELWGYHVDGTLTSMCYSGANLMPVQATPAAVRRFADWAIRRGRRCSSMIGDADAVLGMWDRLRPEWGSAREVRANQPVLAITSPPSVPADPRVRHVRPDELDTLLPAAVAMFIEEVGVSPIGHDDGTYYRARLAELIRLGRAFAIIENDEVIFKAEVGAVTPYACQVQGVWVRPDRRGEGLSIGAMAGVVELALRDIAPAVSLYVNDYNVAARATYRRVGFGEVGRFATVMF